MEDKNQSSGGPRHESVTQGFKTSEFRKKRQEDTISIRKQRREELHLARRMRTVNSSSQMLTPDSPASSIASLSSSSSSVLVSPSVSSSPSVGQATQHLAEMVVEGADALVDGASLMAALTSDDTTRQLQATFRLRQLLSSGETPPIADVIGMNCLPYVVSFLSSKNVKLQFEAAWTLTNIASGDSNQTIKLIEYGAVEPLVTLLSNANWEVREQAVWALGNLAGDGPSTRNQLLQRGILPELLKMIASAMNSPLPQSFMRNTAWTLSNMFRGHPGPQIDLVKDALPYVNMLLRYPDPEVVADMMWATCYATDGNEQRIKTVVEAHIIDTVFDLLPKLDAMHQIPAVRALGNIIAASSSFTESLLQRGIVDILLGIIKNSQKSVKRESCWMLSNIAAESSQSVQYIINGGGINVLVDCIFNSDSTIRKEAAWGLANCFQSATDEQIACIISIPRTIYALAYSLQLKETSLLLAILSAVRRVLTLGGSNPDGINKNAIAFEDAGGAQALEELENHVDNGVYEAASALIDDFFTDDMVMGDDASMEDSGSTTSTPSVFGSGTFGSGSFGSSTPLFSSPQQTSTISSMSSGLGTETTPQSSPFNGMKFFT